MITVEQAKSVVEANFEGAKTKEIYKYKGRYYLVVAPSGAKDYNDPFYIVGIADGKYRFLNPLEDIDAFNDALESGPIKTFSD